MMLSTCRALRSAAPCLLVAVMACASETSSHPTRTSSERVEQGCPPTAAGFPIPGRIEAENFAEGENGVAYNDTTQGNAGGVYRTSDVDLEPTTDEGGGYNLGWTAAGEFLRYPVTVAAGGEYVVAARVASDWATSGFHLEVDGVPIASFDVPDTGGWQNFLTLNSAPVTLSSGAHELRLVADATGFNVNWLEIAKAGASAGGGTSPPPPPPPPPPAGGSPDLTGYQLAFADDFDSMATISEGGAGPGVLWAANNDWLRAGVGTPHISQLSIQGGILRMLSTTDRMANLTTALQSPLWGDTFGGQGFLFGYFESRFFWKGGKGTWPAFWLIGTPINPGPNQGGACEIDIQEGQGAGPTGPNIMNSTVHTNDGGNRHVALADQYVKTLTDGYHVYGMRWTDQRIDFYLDGELKGGIDTPGDLKSTPMHLVIGLQLGDWGAGGNDIDSSTPVPAEMLVDYVRVYQK